MNLKILDKRLNTRRVITVDEIIITENLYTPNKYKVKMINPGREGVLINNNVRVYYRDENEEILGIIKYIKRGFKEGKQVIEFEAYDYLSFIFERVIAKRYQFVDKDVGEIFNILVDETLVNTNEFYKNRQVDNVEVDIIMTGVVITKITYEFENLGDKMEELLSITNFYPATVIKNDGTLLITLKEKKQTTEQVFRLDNRTSEQIVFEEDYKNSTSHFITFKEV